jgi:hypothetical protein
MVEPSELLGQGNPSGSGNLRPFHQGIAEINKVGNGGSGKESPQGIGKDETCAKALRYQLFSFGARLYRKKRL